MEKHIDLMTTAAAFQKIKQFVSSAQISILADLCSNSEERHEFRSIVLSLAERIETMPATYETEGSADPIAFLHYFRGNADFYITEKDCDDDGEGQIQAFGLADIGYGAELGYISIQELIENRVEIDLYFEPKRLSSIRKGD